MSFSQLDKILSRAVKNSDDIEKAAAELDVISNLIIDFYMQEKYHKEKSKQGQDD